MLCHHLLVPLRRPDGVPDRHWEAVETHEGRLNRAIESDDRSAIIGAGKELCECVAAVVCASLAQTVSTADDFGKRISSAHEALDRRPGHGAASEAAVRTIAQTARTIVNELNTLRNEVGTGHGRPVVPVVTRETAAMAEQAARLWSTWALARLDEVLRGEIAGLIRELESGRWHRGLLAQRFEEVGLHSLHSEDQHRLGVAVAHRSSIGQTFVVSEAGVSPIRRDPDAWPPSYRIGVAAGLLLDSNGRLNLRSRYVEDLASIVAVMDPDEWKELADKSAAAMWSADLARDPERQRELADIMKTMEPTLDEPRLDGWTRLIETLRPE